MAQLVLRFDIIWVKSRKTCVSKDDHIIKSTNQISMILVSFYLEVTCTCTCISSDTRKNTDDCFNWKVPTINYSDFSGTPSIGLDLGLILQLIKSGVII